VGGRIIRDAHEETRAYNFGPCRVLVGRGMGRWHLSTSCKDRLPSWAEVQEARRRLIPPEVWMCMPSPPDAYWLNLMPFCLHLWEIADEPLIAMWRDEGRDARLRGFGQPTEERQP